MAGYSHTPLVRKLGIKEGSRVLLAGAPDGFLDTLGELPEAVTLVQRTGNDLDIVMLFSTSRKDLEQRFIRLAKRLAPAGMLWVAWPKKASGVQTDLSFESVQQIGLKAGLVDTKICAVDETWSGLKFVIRVADRKSRPR